MKSFIEKLQLSRYLDGKLVFAIDLFVSVAASMGALVMFMLLLYGVDLPLRATIYWLAVGAVASVIMFYTLKTYRSIIRHSTLREVSRLALAAIGKGLLLSLALLAFPLSGFTPTHLVVLVVIDFLLTLSMLVLVRVTMIVAYDLVVDRYGHSHKRGRVLIYGIQDKAISILARLKNSPHYDVVGFIVPRDSYKPHTISNYKVYYFRTESDVQYLKRRLSADAILFATTADAKLEQERLIKYAGECDIKALLQPSIDEVVGGKLMRNSIREVKIEDLLGRPEIEISVDKIMADFRGKVIMVTGAAGSIGSELCRQLATFGIKQLILFDNGETPMHNLRLELEERFPDLDFVPIIGDVRILARLDFAFRKYRPAVVFHAAAYKHVPLMEENPCEAVLVNVAGSRNVADKCIQYGVEKMVMVSTDKAVNPTNIMGCTKRLAEIYVQALGLAVEQHNRNFDDNVNANHNCPSVYSRRDMIASVATAEALASPRSDTQSTSSLASKENSEFIIQNSEFPNRVIKTKFVTTRFGNVLGSNGSVIPRFREQIAKGGPVTVTHKDITRFFMTIPEACRLVMEAATMTDGNQIFVFDMGESVKIADMARRMIKLAGFVPDKDIMIEYTGLRPGEKLYEEVLATNENTIATGHSRIRIAKVREYDYAEARVVADELEVLSRAVEIPDMVRLMKRTVPEFKSKNSIYEEYDRELEAQAVPLDQAEYYDKDGNHVYYDRKIIKAEQQ